MQLFNLKRLSCGIVIVSHTRELLLCHVTGQNHWDLPKGGIDPGESPLQAALRETREETGLVLDADELLDLGRLRYTAKKDLHLYATLMPRFDVAALHCESHFIDRRAGRSLPEMDGYGWFAFDAVGRLCTPKLAALLTETLGLERVHARLSVLAEPGLATA